MKDLKKIPLNIQFFAEPAPEPDPQTEPAPEPKPEPQLSADEQLQQLMIENAKLKKAQEKAASEAADFKKKYNATLDEKQRTAMEKAEKELEREEQFSQLMRENQVNKLEKSYLKLEYPPDQAQKAAIAFYEGDEDALFKIQSEVMQLKLKEKEAEWLKSRPEVNTGAGDEKTAITKKQFDRMGYSARVEFKQKYPQTYKSYTE